MNSTWQAKPLKNLKKMERKFTGPMEVPPSRSPDKHEDCASRHSLSTVNLFSFIPVRLSSENLQGQNVILDLLFHYKLSINMEKTSANLVREASLDRRLSIALPDIGLFFPVKSGIYEHLHMNIANSLI
jgi:hypothetical protein